MYIAAFQLHENNMFFCVFVSLYLSSVSCVSQYNYIIIIRFFMFFFVFFVFFFCFFFFHFLNIRTHMQDLKDVTNNVHYENYRCKKLAGVSSVTGHAEKVAPGRWAISLLHVHCMSVYTSKCCYHTCTYIVFCTCASEWDYTCTVCMTAHKYILCSLWL